MHKIKNPEYNKWCRELRRWAVSNGYYWEERISDYCGRLHPFTIPQILNLQENENVREWLAQNPMPEKMIDDPEYVAMQNTIKNLEKRCNEYEQCRNVDMHEMLHKWHEYNDALSIEDVQFVVDKLLAHMRYNDTLNLVWSLAEEDEHFYTDKGLEVPFHFNGADEDYDMSMLSVYINRFLVSRNKTREQRYYECLEADIAKRLEKK